MRYWKVSRFILLLIIALITIPFIFGQTCVSPTNTQDGDNSFNDSADESGNDPALTGKWELISGNGQPIAPGVYLQWTFTATTVTITSDLDCTEVLTYSSTGGVLTGISVISREGSECGDDADSENELGSYSVVGNTLTVTTTDPELEPSTIIYIFMKVQ